MNRCQNLSALLAVVFLSATAAADQLPARRALGPTPVYQATAPAKTPTDTVYLIGGPNRTDGDFQVDGDSSLPDWEGWYGVDLTAGPENRWHVDVFNSPSGTPAMWCGELLASCGAEDPPEGYANGYEEWLDWSSPVTDPYASTFVQISYTLNHDSEPGYDYLRLKLETPDGWRTLATYDGSTFDGESWVPVDELFAFTVESTEYVGLLRDEIHLRFEATSDGGWSDSDCLYPSAGLAQIDNIQLVGDNGLIATVDTFEPEAFRSWTATPRMGVGNFAKIWPSLEMTDPCQSNHTPMAAFIDDGIVEPCTGGTLGTTWTYGPGGYIVNLTGGCAGPEYHLDNQIWSPPLAWADELGNPLGDSHTGAIFEYEVWAHLPVDTGLAFLWQVRSSSDQGSTWTPWGARNFWYWPDELYARVSMNVGDLICGHPTHVQLALGPYEIGWVWGFVGTDGTPAPYFDNVSFRIFEIGGPTIRTRELEMAQDDFPAIGTLDYGDLSRNSIRFDMANDILGDVAPAILPGDSLTYDVYAVRSGATLDALPRMYYAIKPNPLFDAVRDPGFAPAGYVEGDTVRTQTGVVVPDRYAFDLPDEGWIFPGDVVHYYIWARDDQAGDLGVTTLPDDLTGFGVFPGDAGYQPLRWPSANVMRGLPSLQSAIPGDQPPILFYNDYGDRGGENEWVLALTQLGLVEGRDYDVYYTNAPSSGVSNGLGARATVSQISGYDTMLYTLGSLSAYGLNRPDQHVDKSDDLGLLDAWLRLGYRDLLLTGDGIVTDLMDNQGVEGPQFVADWLGVQYDDDDVAPLLGGRVTPEVLPVAGNSLGLSVAFVALGGCPGLNQFDAVTPVGETETIAEWADADGQGGAYPYAAGVVHYDATYAARVVYFPVDFAFWGTPPDHEPPAWCGTCPTRFLALNEILQSFGYWPAPIEIGVGDATAPAVLAARAAPNPFNPATEILFDLPRDGRVALRVYDLRGALVRTLVDAELPAGAGHVARWDGADDRGADVASGVYFWRLEAGGETRIGKMSLIR